MEEETMTKDELAGVTKPKGKAKGKPRGKPKRDRAPGQEDAAEGINTKVDTATNSAFSAPMTKQPSELVQTLPGLVESPFGQAYLTRRSRPLPDDELQVVVAQWKSDVACYHDWGTPDTDYDVRNYIAPSAQLDASYGYMRQIIKMARKPRLKSDTLPAGRLRSYYNCYKFAGSNLVWIFGFSKMYRYNQFFQNASTYIPETMVRASMLWRRLMAIIVPDWVKAITVTDGFIANSREFQVPHIRFWTYNGLDMYGGTMGAYDSPFLDEETVSQSFIAGLLASEANLQGMLDDIQSAIEVLEGNPTNTTTEVTDCLAIKEMHEYISTVEGFVPHYSQGLPSEDQLPGLVNSPAIMNDWYAGLLSAKQLITAGADQDVFFPVSGLSEFGGNIPVKGWGKYGMRDFTLLRGALFSTNWATPGVHHGDANIGTRIMGMSRPYLKSATTAHQLYVRGWTREDGDIQLDASPGYAETAAAYASALNLAYVKSRHIYFSAIAHPIATGGGEYRWLDRVPVDWEFWPDPNDYPENTAIFIGRRMGLPYLA